jgi:hypothetical protein
MAIYRCFKSADHAEQFLAGAVRFGHLEYYRELDTLGRGDPTEGQAHHREFRPDRQAVRITKGVAEQLASPGLVDVRAESGNPVYVCGLTQPSSAEAWKRVLDEFGRFVVEIDDPERLRADVQAATDAEDPWQRGAPVALWPARYNKGLELASEADGDFLRDPLKRAATQKPHDYAYQNEQRLVVFSYGLWQDHGPPPKTLTISLPRALEYARRYFPPGVPIVTGT